MEDTEEVEWLTPLTPEEEARRASRKRRYENTYEPLPRYVEPRLSDVLKFKADAMNLLHTNPSEQKSAPINILDYTWQLDVLGHHPGIEGYLVLNLHCNRHNSATTWRCNAEVTFVIDSTVENKVIKHQVSFNYSATSAGHLNGPKGITIPWDLLLNQEDGYLEEEKYLNLEVHITIKAATGLRRQVKYDFTTPANVSDVVLVVEGTKLYVNKGVLSVNSPVFETMFYGAFKESEQNEIEIKDVKYLEFVEMLEVIYPSQKRITDTNVSCLLALADRYEIEVLLEKCQQYLMSPACQVGTMDKLKMAEVYHLDDLQNACYKTLRSQEDFRQLCVPVTGRDVEISDSMKLDLFNVMMRLPPAPPAPAMPPPAMPAPTMSHMIPLNIYPPHQLSRQMPYRAFP